MTRLPRHRHSALQARKPPLAPLAAHAPECESTRHPCRRSPLLCCPSCACSHPHLQACVCSHIAFVVQEGGALSQEVAPPPAAAPKACTPVQPPLSQPPASQSLAAVPRPAANPKRASAQRPGTHYVESGSWLLFEVMDTGACVPHVESLQFNRSHMQVEPDTRLHCSVG